MRLVLSIPLVLFACNFSGGVGDVQTIDEDADSFTIEVDCDDTEPLANPNGVETCDGIDNDCNGAVDDARVCSREEVFLQTSTLDLLFIIDNSSSMLPFQEAVADSIEDLLAVVTGDDSNTHIGAITTDMDDPTASGRLRGSAGARWLDGGSSPNVIDAWTQQGIRAGDAGSGSERGLDALDHALNVHGATYNAGFRRPNAHLVVITLSDERDVSDTTVDDMLDLVDSWGSEATFHAIVPLGAGCGDEWTTSRHIELAAATGGTNLSICEADYGPFLRAVGQFSQRSGLATRFPLVDVVRPGTLEVEVTRPGASEPTLLGPESIALSVDGREVRFTGNNPPPARSRLVVRYEALPHVSTGP